MGRHGLPCPLWAKYHFLSQSDRRNKRRRQTLESQGLLDRFLKNVFELALKLMKYNKVKDPKGREITVYSVSTKLLVFQNPSKHSLRQPALSNMWAELALKTEFICHLYWKLHLPEILQARNSTLH